MAWARRSQIPGFVKLAKTIKTFQQLIWNTLNHNLSNARSEATNTHLRALTRRARGFHTPEALINMAMLTRGGLRRRRPAGQPRESDPRKGQETPIVGYVVSRTAGMPGDGGADIGNWVEPLGLASLLIEGIVILLAVARPTDQSKV